MTAAQHGLSIPQRGVIAELVKKSLRYIVAPNMPDEGGIHIQQVKFEEFTVGKRDEEISLWTPRTESAPNKNPPILRRFIDFRRHDRERIVRGEIVTFPDVLSTYHVITVDQLLTLHPLVRELEKALSQSSNEGLGIPVEWWYGPDDSDDTATESPISEDPGKPLCFRYVDLLSDPVKTAHFSNYDTTLEALNAAFNACWAYLQTLCSTPPVEGVEEDYDVDPHQYARVLLERPVSL